MKRRGRPHVPWTPIVIGVGLLLVGSAGALPGALPWAVGTWEFSSKLTPVGANEPGVGGDPSHAFTHFGSQIALDGSTLVVTTMPDICDGPSWVYVFTRAQGGWEQVAKLSPADGSDVGLDDPSECSGFGKAVAVDDEQGVIVVGNPMLNVPGERQAGAAYVFERAAPGEWTETARFVGPVNGEDGEHPNNPNASIGPYFGFSVSVDAGTIAVGVPGAMGPSGQPSVGGVHVIERSQGGDWVRVSGLSPSQPGHRGVVGHAVAVSGDVIAAGGPNANQVQLYEKTGSTWHASGVLTPLLEQHGIASADSFGFDVAMDGSRLIVGAPSGPEVRNVPVWGAVDSDAGSAYVYRAAPDGWLVEDTLRAGDTLRFGRSVSLHEGTAVVGVPHWPDWSTSVGSTYVFEAEGAGWNPTAKLVSNESSQWDTFGYSVAVGEDTIAVGAPFDDNRRDGTPPPINDEGDIHPLACDALDCSGVDEGESAGSIYLYEPSTADVHSAAILPGGSTQP